MTADDGGNVSRQTSLNTERKLDVNLSQSLCVASGFLKCTYMHMPVNLKPFGVFVGACCVVAQG